MTDTLVCKQVCAATEPPPATQAIRTAYNDATELKLAGTSFNSQTSIVKLVNFEARMDTLSEIRQAHSGCRVSYDHNICSPRRAGQVLETDERDAIAHSVFIESSVSQ